MSNRSSKDPLIRKIDFVFYHEREIYRKINETRKDPNPWRLLIKPSNRANSDPTGNAVVRMLTNLSKITFDWGMELKDPEKWLEVISATYAESDSLSYEIARRRYSGESMADTLTSLGIKMWEYYRGLNRFRILAAEKWRSMTKSCK